MPYLSALPPLSSPPRHDARVGALIIRCKLNWRRTWSQMIAAPGPVQADGLARTVPLGLIQEHADLADVVGGVPVQHVPQDAED